MMRTYNRHLLYFSLAWCLPTLTFPNLKRTAPLTFATSFFFTRHHSRISLKTPFITMLGSNGVNFPFPKPYITRSISSFYPIVSIRTI
ncbi:uncharacterized protein EV420DRAFT_1549385 [Desarmillaria tabescens]|uniref:Secreted protein n=1 Tax=Armillaria tabescens TaxID=1929756 RepID=A0AA39N4Q9_ARMTA|nr:uncharacterized protein EV420DRAFT_1549385 [Desarmillaria tabescens]KAK0457205.1 hypothetical protein EV420DRAFT_1549385 [Desarmillaria tabescens]